jgi:hypothetical protein
MAYFIDVGGGNIEDGDPHPADLASISLRWMLNQVWLHSSVVFSKKMLEDYRIPTDCVPRTPRLQPADRVSKAASDHTFVEELHGHAPKASTSTSSETTIPTWAEADISDCVVAHQDELKKKPLWWITQLFVWHRKS